MVVSPFLSHPGGCQTWLNFTPCVAQTTPGCIKGYSPRGVGQVPGPSPNLIVKVLLVTQEALPLVLHPGLHRTTVQVLVTELLRAEAAPGVRRQLPCLLLLCTALELMQFYKINMNMSKYCWD